MLRKTHWQVILSYGAFLGWLLSFPYNGPILHLLSLNNSVSSAPYSLVYTVIPALFLVSFAKYPAEEKYAQKMMVTCLIASIIGTVLLFALPPLWWFPILGFMGICSVMFIVPWSAFYTRQVPMGEKMRIMALVIIVGNLIFYALKLALPYMSMSFTLVALIGVLALSTVASLRIPSLTHIDTYLESEPFPIKLVLSISAFLFVLKVNGGLTSQVITPTFDELYGNLTRYYGMLPYILTLFALYFLGSRVPRMLPVYLGTSLLGISYVAFLLVPATTVGYLVTETLLQTAWALLHLFWWSLLGEVASLYGRPMKISSIAFVSNLLAMFCGGILGLIIAGSQNGYYLPASGCALIIVLISFLIVPWLDKTMESDLLRKLITNKEELGDGLSIVISLPQADDILTAREREVAALLLQGYTNKDIAAELGISDNTLKTHTRNIYSKLSVANKRELLQLATEHGPSQQEAPRT